MCKRFYYCLIICLLLIANPIFAEHTKKTEQPPQQRNEITSIAISSALSYTYLQPCYGDSEEILGFFTKAYALDNHLANTLLLLDTRRNTLHALLPNEYLKHLINIMITFDSPRPLIKIKGYFVRINKNNYTDLINSIEKAPQQLDSVLHHMQKKGLW